MIIDKIRKIINTKLYNLEDSYITMKFLPFKDVTVDKAEELYTILKPGSTKDLLHDYIIMLKSGDVLNVDLPFVSDTAKTLSNTYFVKARAVEYSLKSASNETINLAFCLSMLDKDAALVGGCVRDSMMSTKPKDWDFVSSLDYDTLAKSLETAGYQVITTGKNFLVMNVTKNGEMFEIATYRKDGDYVDGRRPESVEVGDIFSDAQRRDLTVNSLYFRLSDNVLLDPTGEGLQDVIDRVLKFVGKPEERLKEDSLRAVRFYRFIQKGFTPDKKSLKAVRSHWEECIKRTSPERIKNEIEKMVGLSS